MWIYGGSDEQNSLYQMVQLLQMVYSTYYGSYVFKSKPFFPTTFFLPMGPIAPLVGGHEKNAAKRGHLWDPKNLGSELQKPAIEVTPRGS